MLSHLKKDLKVVLFNKKQTIKYKHRSTESDSDTEKERDKYQMDRCTYT